MTRIVVSLAFAAALLAGTGGSAWAAPPSCRAELPAELPCQGMIYLNDVLVRTILTPSATPNAGVDNFYKVAGVGGVAAVGPGTGDYHGGRWKVFLVSGSTAGLTSEAAIELAAAKGLVTITREASQDFRCPIQP